MVMYRAKKREGQFGWEGEASKGFLRGETVTH
jgi:hypothetical protein